jgi:SSS family solute:Na+ symporter
MSTLDWDILGGTLLFIVLYGSWKNKQQRSIKGYIKGGASAAWWTVGLSVMATQASSITFLSTPGQAFHEGMGFVQFYFGLPLAMVIICLFFLPVYHKLNVYTAYEYLEKRFDLKTRTLTALLFLIQRGLAAGITIYAPAIILNIILGWDLKLLVVGIGGLVIIYTMIGGTQAVNVTQKLQMLIIFLGLVAAFVFTVGALPKEFSFENALQLASLNDKLNVLNFDINLNNRYTFWSGLTGGLFLALSYFGTDQSQVQRYLSGRSLKQSQMGLIMNGFLKVPLQFFILLVGVLVFVFYQFDTPPLHFNPANVTAVENSSYAQEYKSLTSTYNSLQQDKKTLLYQADFFENPALQKQYTALAASDEELRNKAKILISTAAPEAEVNDKDYVFISFILAYLPHGLIGLLMAMIFSAAMSSTASELNALSATTLIDLYKVHWKTTSEQQEVRMAKIFTLVWGLIAILFASIGNFFENLIQLVNIIGSLFYGTILGIFLVAFFMKKVHGKAVFIAALLSEAIVLGIYFGDWVSYLWLNVIGAVLTMVFAFVIQNTSTSHANT